MPPFNLSYNPLLEQLASKGFDNYPAETKLQLQFMRPDGSLIPIDTDAIQDIEYRIFALERIPGNER
ncbi:MAG: hypothetical protein H7222_09210 [Methylotenera sp.]|nr:hypothetical protein [Oligoflexia bacterium]